MLHQRLGRLDGAVLDAVDRFLGKTVLHGCIAHDSGRLSDAFGSRRMRRKYDRVSRFYRDYDLEDRRRGWVGRWNDGRYDATGTCDLNDARRIGNDADRFHSAEIVP